MFAGGCFCARPNPCSAHQQLAVWLRHIPQHLCCCTCSTGLSSTSPSCTCSGCSSYRACPSPCGCSTSHVSTSSGLCCGPEWLRRSGTSHAGTCCCGSANPGISGSSCAGRGGGWVVCCATRSKPGEGMGSVEAIAERLGFLSSTPQCYCGVQCIAVGYTCR